MFGKNINCDFGSLISHLLDPTKKERKKKKEKTFTQLMELLVSVRVIIRSFFLFWKLNGIKFRVRICVSFFFSHVFSATKWVQ